MRGTQKLERQVNDMKKTLLILATVGLLGTGCAGMSNGSNGALMGGLLGALAGQALGHDTKSTLIGTGVGAAVGYGVGNEVDKNRNNANFYKP